MFLEKGHYRLFFHVFLAFSLKTVYFEINQREKGFSS